MYIPNWLIVTAVILGIVYYTQHHRQYKASVGFAPVKIRVSPNWYELLKDYKLIDDEGWKELDKKISESKTKFHVFQYGISFTVLRNSIQENLVYNNYSRSFHSRVDFWEELEELNKRVRFWVEEGLEGYDIGITTPESWKKVIMVGDDNDHVKITTIPYALFQMPRYRFGMLKPGTVKEMLKKHGWERDKIADEYKSDVLFEMPEELNHKYFHLEYSDI